MSKSPNNEQDAFRDSVHNWNLFVIRDLHIKMSQVIVPTSGIIRIEGTNKIFSASHKSGNSSDSPLEVSCIDRRFLRG